MREGKFARKHQADSEQQWAATSVGDSQSDDDGPERDGPISRQLESVFNQATWTHGVPKRARRHGLEQKGGGATESAKPPSPAVQADPGKLKRLEKENTKLLLDKRAGPGGRTGSGA
jgi:hypothetical protein